MKVPPEYHLYVTPARAAAFGTAVGGLFALLVLNLLGGAGEVGSLPASAFIMLAQAAGALVTWTAARNGVSQGR